MTTKTFSLSDKITLREVRKMIFEEEFPRLNTTHYPLVLKGDYDMSSDIFGQFISCAQVQKHCLDKKRVKEALNMFNFPDADGETQEAVKLTIKLIKEQLGLEDE